MSKSLIENQRRSISIKFLAENGLLNLNQEASFQISWSDCNTDEISVKVNTVLPHPFISFRYDILHSGEHFYSMNYKLNLVPQKCHFGNERWFLQCGRKENGSFCGKKVYTLYLRDSRFRCRSCHNLTYESCNEKKPSKNTFLSGLDQLDKADRYYEKRVKKEYYQGKPTKQYLRYLKLIGEPGSSERPIKLE